MPITLERSFLKVMGVPRLFPWLVSTFPNAVIRFRRGEYSMQVDNLYLDANGFLHSAAQAIFNYGNAKRKMDPYASLDKEAKVKLCFDRFFDTILELCRIVTPTRVLFIAIDGPAPLAKQAQQRQRRFVSSLEIQTSDTQFGSPEITPGTSFMFELTKYMNYRIRKEIMNNHFLQGVEVIFSPPSVPGEGEHKILDYLRNTRSENQGRRHCLFGPDGDLVMLTLSSHVQNMFLFREDQNETGYYHIVDMGSVRWLLPGVMGSRKVRNHSLNDVTNDFILAGFFVGNDFLPKIRMFMFLEDGLRLMISTCFDMARQDNLFLTNSNKINFKGLTKFIKILARNEVKYIYQQSKVEIKDPMFINKTLLSHIIDGKLNFETYRKDYYLKAGVSLDSVKNMCVDYLRSIKWVFDYYVKRNISWTHFYPWHYAPLMTDLVKVLEEGNSDLVSFELGEPSTPFVQLLSVLPSSCYNLLPPELNWLMTKKISPLVQKGMYPDSFDIDYEGVPAKFMGVALLPFIDIKLVRDVVSKINIRDQTKNKLTTKNNVFRYVRSGYLSKYSSSCGVVEKCKVRKEEI